MTVSIETINQALEAVEYNDLSHEEKYQVLLALDKELNNDGLMLYATWAGKSINEVQKQRKQFKRKNSFNIGTLFRLAKQHGWKGNTIVGLKNKLFGYTADETYSQRYVQSIDIVGLHNPKIIGVKSTQETGKTEQLKNLLSQIKQDGLVLVIGHRRVLLLNMSRRLGGVYYEEVAVEEWSKATSLAVTLDSLIKLDTRQLANINAVVFDECSQVLYHLCGDTVKPNRKNTLTVLKYLCRKAKHIICLDADLVDYNIQFFKDLIQEPNAKTWLIENDFKPRAGETMYRFDENNKDSFSMMLAQAKNDVENGLKVYFYASSKETAKDVYAVLSPLVNKEQSILITSENSGTKRVQEYIRNIKTSTKNTKVLVCSPSLSTGADIQEPFDSVYLYGSKNEGVQHTDLIQSALRVRNSTNRYSLVEHNDGHRPIDPDIIKEVLVNSGQLLFELGDDGEKYLVKDNDEAVYSTLYCYNEARKNFSINCLVSNYYQQLEDDGWYVEMVETEGEEFDEATALKETVKELRKSRKEQKLDAIIDADDVDFSEFQKLRVKQERTPEEENKYLKYAITKEYALPELTTTDIAHFVDFKGFESFRNYVMLIVEDEKTLKEFDRELRAKDTLLSDLDHNLKKKELRKNILELAFETTVDEVVKGSSLTTVAGFKSAKKYIEDNADAVSLLLGINSKKTGEVIRQVCKQLGLETEEKGQRRDGKKKVRIYGVHNFHAEYMQKVVERRIEAINKFNKESADCPY